MKQYFQYRNNTFGVVLVLVARNSTLVATHNHNSKVTVKVKAADIREAKPGRVATAAGEVAISYVDLTSVCWLRPSTRTQI